MDIKEIIELETPVLHKKVVLRGYITGGIREEINNALLGELTYDMGDTDLSPEDRIAKAKQDMKLSYKQIAASNAKALDLIVLSVDGVTDNASQLVRDLPEGDYEFVKAEVEKIKTPLDAITSTN